MRDYEAQVCTTEPDFLGECCRWDPVHQELLWVNQASGWGQMYRATVSGTEVNIVRRYDFSGSPSAFAPVAARDAGWIVAIDRALWLMDRDGQLREVAAAYDDHDVEVHLNDGSADPWGRFWIGSMSHDASPGRGALFRYDAVEGLTTILEGITISNGIAWSPNRDTMYHVDSGPGVIRAFDVDAAGEISGSRVFAQFDVAKEGTPDGLCVDEQGAIWVAVWGGYEVRHYSHRGELLGRVHVDTAQPSSCALGGREGTSLYITTAQEDMTAEQLAHETHAGRLFCAEVGVRGLAPLNFNILATRTGEHHD